MRLWAVVGVLLAIGGPATAQEINWGLFPQANSNAYAEGYNQAARMEAIAVQRQVGQLLAANQCDEAEKTALVHGMFDLARQARAFCGR